MKTLFIALVVSIGLVGCIDNDEQSNLGQKISNGEGTTANVLVIKLEDCTPCAVLIGYYRGAIDCDWKNNGQK